MRDDRDRATWPADEPCFEAPPRLAPSRERRLTAHAEAAFRTGTGSHAFRDNALSLTRMADGTVTVTAAGRSLSAALGFIPGPLAGPPDGLAAALVDAFACASASGGVTAFEAAVAAPGTTCLLLRGVMLPTATGAEAVLSWKQVLGDDATARLRAELLRELRPRAPRAALVNVFG